MKASYHKIKLLCTDYGIDFSSEGITHKAPCLMRLRKRSNEHSRKQENFVTKIT